MRRSILGAGRALLVFLSAAACLLLPPERVESQTPSGGPAELMQIFQGLTPEQQQAIMQQLGGAGGAGGVSGILGALGGGNLPGGQGGGRSAAGQQPTELPEETEAPEPPGFNPEDWVIVQVEAPAPPAAPATTTANQAAPPSPLNLPPGLANNPGQAAALGSLLAQTATASPPPPPQSRGTAPQSELVVDRERQRLLDMVDLIRSKNPYRLTREGALLLPGFAPISLLGLSDDQATLRLSVEPALRNLSIHVTKMPLRRAGVEGLKPFGYDMFGKKTPSTFAPFNNIPVPADYIVGAGDIINVQLYGNQNRILKLTVSRDGNVNLPDIGPVSVAGQHFTSIQSDIQARIQRQLTGVKASVSMGDTRSIHVYVLGEAKRPGSYTLSSLSTVTASLYAAGGVKIIGSLRAIVLKRGNELVRRLDLYDLLIRGDNADDAPLMEGDVVFVPPVGQTVSVDGEVRRPAIYELRGESNVAALVQLAGGLTAEADHATIVLTRIDAKQHRVVLPVNLDTTAREQALRNGDVLHVARLRPTLDSGIVVQGYVYSPGDFAWHSGLRLTDVLPSVDQLKPNADLHYVLIRRESGADRHISVLSVDLAAALSAPGSDVDAALMPRDRITVFDLQSGRDRVIQPVLEELRLQGSAQQPTQVVHIVGRVKVPGDYPLETGMRVGDLVRAGGGTTDAAYGQSAELVRYTVVNGEMRQTDLINVDLGAAISGSAVANLRLQPFDTLTVKEVPEWRAQEAVTLRGEVRFPGVYAIRRGETLKSVLDRAGGLTKFAFADGSVFTREELKRREQEQLDMLADRMQRDVALLALQSAAANQQGAATALSVGQSLLGQLKGAQAVGRLVIDLPRLEESAAGSVYDVVLRDGDTLSVPRYEQQVTVIGEVQTVTSHLYNPRLQRDDYIALSGGVTSRADKGRIYIVRASGSVIAGSGSRWFDRNGSAPIKPGDTIVVPLDTEHIPALPLWTQVTQILYNVAIAILAIRSV